jgi:hypothetical protein
MRRGLGRAQLNVSASDMYSKAPIRPTDTCTHNWIGLLKIKDVSCRLAGGASGMRATEGEAGRASAHTQVYKALGATGGVRGA